MNSPEPAGPNRPSSGIPPHLDGWLLPPDWRWGSGGVYTPFRHAQEVVDALGRSLALVTAPDAAHHAWLFREARHLAHRSHPSVPTTYHFWQQHPGSRRGPGYLRRWITGETVGERLRRSGNETVPFALRFVRSVGSALAYLHDSGMMHGAIAPETTYLTPTGRLWLLGWQWAVPRDEIPAGIAPGAWCPAAPEWEMGWRPSPASDQWQLGALAFALLTGEVPTAGAVPPIRVVRPDCPATVADLVDRMLSSDPAARFASIAGMLRRIERLSGTSSLAFPGTEQASGEHLALSEEDRLRWATGDDYEVLAPLGVGTYGSVWRVRDLSLEREVALKMLHPTVARNSVAVGRFRREAQLAAQLQHPAIVPIFAWDSKGDVNWYIMELEEEGSVADLVKRDGPRGFAEIAPQVDAVLDGLAVAHANGIIHRDLKPENILIDRYRRWRIADFGIANALGASAAGASGTPAFAAPEQLLGEEQGVGTDLFAVAGIVHFALSGRPPFEGTDGRTILAAQLAGRLSLEGFSEELAAWLRRGLASDQTQRFPTAEAMRTIWRGVTRSMARDAKRSASQLGALLRRFGFVAVFACGLAAPLALEAQRQVPPPDSTRADSVRRIEQVRVEVTRQPTLSDRVAWAVGSQDARDLRRAQATLGIDEALANIPGVVISNRYNYALDQRLSIRGAGSRANFGLRGLKVLLDGVPQSLPDGQSQLTNVDLAAIGRVEVLRGSASSLYGNGSGGVIAFTTDLGAPDPLGASLRLTTGSYGLSKTQARVSGRAGRNVATLSASRTTTDGFRQYSSADTRQLMAAWDRSLSDRLRLAVRIGTAETPHALNPGALTLAEFELNPDTAALNNTRRGARRSVSQRYASVRVAGELGAGEWSAALYGQRRFVDNPLAVAPPGGGGVNGTYNTIDRRVTGLRLDASRTFARAGEPRVAVGMDLQRSFDVRRNRRSTGGAIVAATDTLLQFQGETVVSVGPFAQMQYDLGPDVTLSVGGRLDWLSFRVDDHFVGDGDVDSGERTMEARTGHVGVVWRSRESFVPYANVSTAFETPTTTELNARSDGTGGFNPALDPQRVLTVEAGARGSVGTVLRYEAAVFRAETRDAIVQYLETAGRAYFRNAGRTQSRGIELGLTAEATRWLRLRSAVTLADYQFLEYRIPSASNPPPAQDTLDGNRLAGVPTRAWRVGAVATRGAFSLDVEHSVQGPLWGDDANTVRVPGWDRGQLNLRAAWSRVIRGWRVEPFAALQNALDSRYAGAITLNGFGGRVFEPAPRRNWYAGMEISAPIVR